MRKSVFQTDLAKLRRQARKCEGQLEVSPETVYRKHFSPEIELGKRNFAMEIVLSVLIFQWKILPVNSPRSSRSQLHTL